MEIFLTAFLILLNGFFVAAEFAIVKVRITQLDSAADHISPKLLQAAKRVTKNLDNYLAATQLGVTLASLGLGYVAEDVMKEMFTHIFTYVHLPIAQQITDKLAVFFGFIFITILHIVFGELAPKSIAIRKSLQTTFLVAYPLGIFYYVCKPFIWILNKLSSWVLAIFRIEPSHDQDVHTEEEIKLIISDSGDRGGIENSERELINNVFEFDTRRVREIQIHPKDLVALDIKDNMIHIVKKISEEGYSRYPVYEENLNNLKGILFIKDLMKQISLGKKVENIKIKELLRPVYYIPDSMKIKDLLKSLQISHLQMAVVTDEYGDISGIVTMEDILEELVGDIQDEHDAELPIVEPIADNTFLVSSHESIDDINEFLPYPLEEDDHYNTLSGLINYNRGSIPTEGEVLELNGYEIIIKKMYRSSVEQVEMKLLPATIKQLEEAESEEDED